MFIPGKVLKTFKAGEEGKFRMEDGKVRPAAALTFCSARFGCPLAHSFRRLPMDAAPPVRCARYTVTLLAAQLSGLLICCA